MRSASRAAVVLLLLASGPLAAEPGGADPRFEARFRSASSGIGAFRVRGAPRGRTRPDEGGALVATSTQAPLGPGREAGADLVDASARVLALFAPPALSEADLAGAVRERLGEVEKCYGSQLAREPGWSGRLLLDVGIRRNGRVSEVSVSPREVARSALGRCLLKRVPHWRFPAFTGETEPELTREAVTATFAFVFDAAAAAP